MEQSKLIRDNNGADSIGASDLSLAPGIVSYAPNYLIAFCGPRRGGKSSSMAYFIVGDLLRGREVYCNEPYHVKFTWAPTGEVYETRPLEPEKLYEFGLRNCTIVIDELPLYADPRDFMSTRVKFLDYVCAQCGHVDMNFYYTSQGFEWVSPRIRYLLDGLFWCTDTSRSEWGKENHIPPGQYSSLIFWDMSGVFGGEIPSPHIGGYRNNPYLQPHKYLRFDIRTVYDIYDTHAVIDPLAARTQVKAMPEQVMVGRGKEQADQKAVMTVNAVDYLVRHIQGEGRIHHDELWEMAKPFGLSTHTLGAALKDAGVTTTRAGNRDRYYVMAGEREAQEDTPPVKRGRRRPRKVVAS